MPNTRNVPDGVASAAKKAEIKKQIEEEMDSNFTVLNPLIKAES